MAEPRRRGRPGRSRRATWRVTFPPRRGQGAARAVDGVNLALGRGEVLALIGESGLRQVAPWPGPWSDWSSRPRRDPVRRRAAACAAGRACASSAGTSSWCCRIPYGALNPRQNVYDAVAEGLRLHGQRQGLTRRVAEALEQVGMRPPEHFFDRYPHQLSGGQQQRVVIAGALTLGPDVLVADEPVSSLDASVRGEILKLFLGLRDELGLAALVVSHDLGLAWNIADRVAVMYLGRIVEVGTRRGGPAAPAAPYTRALLEAVPSTSGRTPSAPLRGEPPDPTAIPTRVPVPSALPAARHAARGHGPRVPRPTSRSCRPGGDTRQVACFHVDEWQSARRSTPRPVRGEHVTEHQPRRTTLRRPPRLRPGDRVALLTPSSPSNLERIDEGIDVLRFCGLQPVEYPSARARGVDPRLPRRYGRRSRRRTCARRCSTTRSPAC